MAQAEIRIDVADDRLSRSRSGNVLGGIWLSVDGSAFPTALWSDFIVVVLGWWCQALLELLSGDQGPIEVNFMDGPYRVDLGPLDRGSLHVVLVERDRKGREADVEVGPLVLSVLSAAARTLQECKAHNWWSRDEETLAQAREDLRRAILRPLG
jgi:hypothetical protein